MPQAPGSIPFNTIIFLLFSFVFLFVFYLVSFLGFGFELVLVVFLRLQVRLLHVEKSARVVRNGINRYQ